MKPDAEKTKDDLISEMNTLQKELNNLEAECSELKKRCEESHYDLRRECSKRDHTEEALRLAEMILDQSPVILFRRLAGEDPKLVYVSHNISRFGYTAEEFLSGAVTFRDIVYPGDEEPLGEEIRGFAEQDVEEYTQFYRIVTKSGNVRWVEDQTSVVRDSEGNKIFNQGIVVDITERKLAEDNLRKSEEKFRRIVETAGEGFILMDEDLHIMDVNDAYCRMLGYSRGIRHDVTTGGSAKEEFSVVTVGGNNQTNAIQHRPATPHRQ